MCFDVVKYITVDGAKPKTEYTTDQIKKNIKNLKILLDKV